MRNGAFCIAGRPADAMSKAITLHLNDADDAALQQQADQLRVRPGTLARILVHAGLTTGISQDRDSAAGRDALERLVRRSQQREPADAVALVTDARVALAHRR